MKKLIALLLCLAFALTLGACGKSAAPGSKDTADASASAQPGSSAVVEEEEEEDFNVPEGYELKVAFADNNAPYSFVDESGEVVGVDVDIARAVCEKRGWVLKAQTIDWTDSKVREATLSGGEVDCIWGSLPFNEVNDSETMWNSYGSIYVDAVVLDGSGFYKLEDLKGKTIEVEPGSMFALEGDSATELGKQLSKNVGKIQQVADAQTAYQDLADGKCDAIVVNGAADDQVVLDDFDVYFMTIYDIDVYNDSEDSSDGELVEVNSNSICDLEMGAAFLEDSDVYYATAVTMDSLNTNGTLSSILDDWSQKDNGTYAAAVSRCALYQIEEVDEEDLNASGDDGSIDWDALEDWDGEESQPDESMADITVDEPAEPGVTVVK